jgi:UDP-N-acetylglucosamine 2-epimerase
VARLLDDGGEMRRMTSVANPYGDGQASARIVRSLLEPAAPDGA